MDESNQIVKNCRAKKDIFIFIVEIIQSLFHCSNYFLFWIQAAMYLFLCG